MLLRTRIILVLQLFYIQHVLGSVVVRTNLGDIEGLVVQKQGRTTYQFLNVPYAQPPIHDLRFKKPLTVRKWNGVYNATLYGPSCMQIRPDVFKQFLPNLNMSEDCLFLNIFVPNDLNITSNKSVMIWVHGGGNVVGQAEMYDGSNLALAGDIIVVTINYRVGVFGFLTTGNKELPGNYGLWDQLLAIKWVKENILTFGGNPNSITLFGQSAGSYDACTFLISPASEGLFQRVIGESGSCLRPAFIKRIGAETISKLARTSGCPLPISNATVTCLRQIPAGQLLNITNIKLKISEFGPTIDNDLLTDFPDRLLTNKLSKSYELFSSRDVLFGANSAEGGLNLTNLRHIPNINITSGIPTDVFCGEIVPEIIAKYFQSTNETLINASCEFYRTKTLEAQAKNTINFIGDLKQITPLVQLLNYHSKTPRSTYQYLFSHQSSFFRIPVPPWYKGANHGDELAFVFGRIDMNPIVKPNDQVLADLMMTYWTNFAKYGNPNGLSEPNKQTVLFWPSYQHNKAYMNFDYNSSVQHNVFKKRVDFWRSVWPTLQTKTPDPASDLFG